MIYGRYSVSQNIWTRGIIGKLSAMSWMKIYKLQDKSRKEDLKRSNNNALTRAKTNHYMKWWL